MLAFPIILTFVTVAVLSWEQVKPQETTENSRKLQEITEIDFWKLLEFLHKPSRDMLHTIRWGFLAMLAFPIILTLVTAAVFSWEQVISTFSVPVF
jgi:hypothetical protein